MKPKTHGGKRPGAKPIGRPHDEGEPKDRVITLRTTKTRKDRYLDSAKKSGQNLTEWILKKCDKVENQPLN